VEKIMSTPDQIANSPWLARGRLSQLAVAWSTNR